MNSASREQLLATKERLHKLTQENRQEERSEFGRGQKDDRSQQRQHTNKVKLLAEQEKAQAEKRAREDARYLRRHNRTVSKVLSQVAKADGRGELNNEDGSEDDGEEDDGEESDSEDDQERHQKYKQRSSTEGGKEGLGKGNQEEEEIDPMMTSSSSE